MKIKVLSALLFAALLGTATVANACNCGSKGTAMKCGGMQSQGPSGMNGNGMMMQKQKHMVRKVIAAVSKAGLDSKQTAAITDAINTFKASRMELKANRMQMMPIDAFGDDKFDAELFKEKKRQMFEAKVGGCIELLKTVYAVLTPEQRKIFKREFTAPMVQMMIKQNMIKGGMQGSGMGKGMKCGGSMGKGMKCGSGMGCKNCN